MLTQLYPFLDPACLTPSLAPRLRALADDCDNLVRNRSVSSSLLQDAPLLVHWFPILSSEGVELAGHVFGHPTRPNGFMVTSPLWLADPDGAWVRTLSRFYRLEPPRDPDEIRRILSRAVSTAAMAAGRRMRELG